jgi:hypothetical protein
MILSCCFLNMVFLKPQKSYKHCWLLAFFFVGMGVPCPLVVILVSYMFISLLNDVPYVSLSLGEFPSPTQSMLRPNSF